MSWQDTWKGKQKKDKPNSLRTKPTIAFRSNLSVEALSYIKKLIIKKEKSKFINQAIEMKYLFTIRKDKFIYQIIKENFQLVKHLLRKEGSRRNGVTKQ